MSEEMMRKARQGAFYAIYALMILGNIDIVYNHICMLACVWMDVCMPWQSFKILPANIHEEIQSCVFLLITPVMLFFSIKNLRERKIRALGVLFVPFGFLILSMLAEGIYGWLAY